MFEDTIETGEHCVCILNQMQDDKKVGSAPVIVCINPQSLQYRTGPLITNQKIHCTESTPALTMSNNTIEEPQQCYICQYLIGEARDEDGTEIIVRTVCGHIFGNICLNTWLEKANTCPLCRHQVVFGLERPPLYTNSPLDAVFGQLAFEMTWVITPMPTLPHFGNDHTVLYTVPLPTITARQVNAFAAFLSNLPIAAPQIVDAISISTFIADIHAYLHLIGYHQDAGLAAFHNIIARAHGRPNGPPFRSFWSNMLLIGRVCMLLREIHNTYDFLERGAEAVALWEEDFARFI